MGGTNHQHEHNYFISIKIISCIRHGPRNWRFNLMSCSCILPNYFTAFHLFYRWRSLKFVKSIKWHKHDSYQGGLFTHFRILKYWRPAAYKPTSDRDTTDKYQFWFCGQLLKFGDIGLLQLACLMWHNTLEGPNNPGNYALNVFKYFSKTRPTGQFVLFIIFHQLRKQIRLINSSLDSSRCWFWSQFTLCS